MYRQDELITTGKLKPVRCGQYVLSVFLFHLGVFLGSIPESYMSSNNCTFLMVLGFVFAMITGLAIMVQRNSDPIRITKMLVFCFFGVPLFVIVGCMCFFSPDTDQSYWAVQVSTLFSFIVAGLFLIEILLVLPISMKNRSIIPPRPSEELSLFRGLFSRK